MRADLGQLASSEVWRGLGGSGEATVNQGVQGDQRGQQLTLTDRETKRGFNSNKPTHRSENVRA